MAALVVLCAPASSFAHAGHDAIPEADFGVSISVPPRFYAKSDQIEGTIVLPAMESHGSPRVFLMAQASNEPVTSASIRAEMIRGRARDVSVEPGELPGEYVLRGLTLDATTRTLSLEVSKGDLFEILSFADIVVPAEASAPTQAAVASARRAFPRYLINALLAINALLITAIIIMMLRSRRRDSAAMLGIVVCATLALRHDTIRAHAGDPHEGQGFSGASSIVPGEAHHFVPIDTQVQAGIRTAVAEEKQLPGSFRTLGRVMVRPDMEAVITPPADGRLLFASGANRIPITGEKVKEGQVLAVLEQMIPPGEKVSLLSERDQAQSELNQVRQQVKLAGQSLERVAKLGAFVSQAEKDQARTEFEVQRDKQAGLEERLHNLSSALLGTTTSVRNVEIRSPIAGVISESHSTLGEYVAPSKQLFRIINIEKVFVAADVFESDFPRIRDASRARITMEAYPNEAFGGEFHSVGQEVDPRRRTMRIIYDVDNSAGKLRAGMFANVDIQSSATRAMLTVPKSAIMSQDNVRMVYRKEAPELYASHVVDVAEFREDVAVISGGLQPGDRVAVQGMYQIRMSPVVGAARK